MHTFCPFCKTSIPANAVICPHCTRDTRDLKSVFGPPPSPEEQERRAESEAREYLPAVGITIGLTVAITSGHPFWLICLLAGAGWIVGEVISHWLLPTNH